MSALLVGVEAMKAKPGPRDQAGYTEDEIEALLEQDFDKLDGIDPGDLFPVLARAAQAADRRRSKKL
jgi:hypothetical protein